MLSSALLVSAVLLLTPLSVAASPLSSSLSKFQAPTTLNLTSLGARDGLSTIECWQLANPFQTTNQVGVPGTSQLHLGNITDMSYTVVPPKYFPPRHPAPIIQYGLFLSGLAHITLPSGNNEAYVGGTKNSLLIATDVAAVSRDGHFTVYPSGEETILLQFPINDGVIPPHKVLHDGPCTIEEGI